MSFVVWQSGFEYDADPQKVYEEIAAIGEAPTPQQIVDRAADENSAMHGCFTWDDTKAANNWRKQEARTMLSRLVIQRRADDDSVPEVRVFHHVEGYSGYRQTVQIFHRTDERLALLRQIYRELESLKRKYELLCDLPEMMKLLDAVNEMVA